MRARSFAALAALALVAPRPAHAAPDDEKPPPPELSLSVQERGPRQPWQLTVRNDGKEAAMLFADPRLLSFEVKVPGKKQSARCRLPDGLVPKQPDRRTRVVLGPGEGVTHSFDPRLYCFAAGGQWQLVPGAIVEPRFGWDERTRTVWKQGKRSTVALPSPPPFVATGLAQDPDDLGLGDGVKSLRAEPFALRSEYARWSATRLEEDRKLPPGPLSLELTQGSDAAAELSASLSLVVRNRSKRTQQLYFRRELVTFEIMGPDGLSTCNSEPDLRAPDRQAFITLAPGRSLSILSRLVELCPRGAFARPGLYLVHARFDSTESGEEFGMDAYVGRVFSPEPAAIRIRTGELPFLKRRAMRPLGPPPAPPAAQ